MLKSTTSLGFMTPFTIISDKWTKETTVTPDESWQWFPPQELYKGATKHDETPSSLPYDNRHKRAIQLTHIGPLRLNTTHEIIAVPAVVAPGIQDTIISNESLTA